MSEPQSLPIVGAYYRPPAKALIDALAVGTPLMLMAEPENPYDPFAVAVWLNTSDIPVSANAKLEETLPQFGHDLSSIQAEPCWHLGYVPKEMARTLRENGTVPLNTTVSGKFATAANGAPRVRLLD